MPKTVRYSNPQFFEAATTARTRRIAGVAGNVVLEHRDFYIDLLDNVAVQTALIDISENEANKGNEGFATALSGFRNAFSGELASTDDAEFRQAVATLVRNDIATWLDDAVVVDALNAHNRQTAGYSQQRIMDLEEQWLSEFESGAYDLIETVNERHVSRFLRRVKRDSVGIYRELYVMDGVGLIVGASNPNDDYWQGAEEMWLETSKPGGSTLHIGTLAFDESTLAWGIEITLPVFDPATDRRIGAITFELDPSMLERSL